MADGRREHDFDVAIAQTAYIRAAFGMGGKFDPLTANPYSPRYVEEDIRTEEEKKDATKEGIAKLKMGLAWMVATSGRAGNN